MSDAIEVMRPHLMMREGSWVCVKQLHLPGEAVRAYTVLGCGATWRDAWEDAFPSRPWWKFWKEV